jgi:hypothetical protein
MLKFEIGAGHYSGYINIGDFRVLSCGGVACFEYSKFRFVVSFYGRDFVVGVSLDTINNIISFDIEDVSYCFADIFDLNFGLFSLHIVKI